jgi:thioredoxin 1
MPSSPIVSLDDQTFDATAQAAHGTLVVDFWAPWCGPCRAMEGIFATLAEQLSGRVAFAKVNVDDNPELARRFRVRSIPTVVVFRDGQVVQSVVGAQSLQSLSELVGAH